jgi:hypothetical protein
MGQLESV